MEQYYTREKNAQVIISLLKQHGIRQVVASPGSANMAMVASLQSDDYFEMYSSVDERSAAYMACGLAAESAMPVVITCTGATASRNYMPGLTEAFYRKLPILAITSTQAVSKVGHHVAQVIDRSVVPNDVVKLSVTLPIVKDDDDIWDCEIKVNRAILELKRHGGGPVHINLPTTYIHKFDVKELHQYRKISQYTFDDQLPSLPSGRIAVSVGAHLVWNFGATQALERFCEINNAVVLCDHTSGYNGKYRVQYALAGCQKLLNRNAMRPDLLIHIGEVSGDYYTLKVGGGEIWRVSLDGEIRDTFRGLSAVFEMSEESFFKYYTIKSALVRDDYYRLLSSEIEKLNAAVPEVPLSNIWVASQMASKLPDNSVIHFGILNSLRAWNFFELPSTVTTASNVGGFGIDGILSSILGASLFNKEKLYFCVIGDLAFFYDMNALGNRHVGKNLRILLINNGTGTEFKQYGDVSSRFGPDIDRYVSAGGHFGNKSKCLVKNYAQDLGFEYMSAADKEQCTQNIQRFLDPADCKRPMVFEVFTDSDAESEALEMMMNLYVDKSLGTKKSLGKLGRKILGKAGVDVAKKVLGR
jgi:2-succinyl-5-enolpyruvyl-6-hydroxy-3-cyclohexene-1-carboxylate synthase